MIYADCARQSGDGSKRAPFARITDAVAAARAQASATRLIVSVAPGTCANETLPIVLDFPVSLRGSRVAAFDADGLPTGEAESDTIVTAAAPPSFFRVTGEGVHVSRLTIDGQVDVLAVGAGARTSLAVDIAGSQRFVVEDLRITRVTNGIYPSASSGTIARNHLRLINSAIAVMGGTPASPAHAHVHHNRIVDHSAGIAVLGAGPAGTMTSALVEDNDLYSSRANSGPSNPYGLRVQTMGVTSLTHGDISATFLRNKMRGKHRMPVIINAGNAIRTDGKTYTATVDVVFQDNVLEGGWAVPAPTIMTFTNSRMADLPCELRPGSTCPTAARTRIWYTYLQDSTFVVTHGGELSGYALDHPANHPVDGTPLNNVLIVNGETIPNSTFIVVP